MKYKLPVPEDYPDQDAYAYKIADAYSKIYVDFHSVLIVIELAVKALEEGDDIDKEVAMKMLNDVLKKRLNEKKH